MKEELKQVATKMAAVQEDLQDTKSTADEYKRQIGALQEQLLTVQERPPQGDDKDMQAEMTPHSTRPRGLPFSAPPAF